MANLSGKHRSSRQYAIAHKEINGAFVCVASQGVGVGICNRKLGMRTNVEIEKRVNELLRDGWTVSVLCFGSDERAKEYAKHTQEYLNMSDMVRGN